MKKGIEDEETLKLQNFNHESPYKYFKQDGMGDYHIEHVINSNSESSLKLELNK